MNLKNKLSFMVLLLFNITVFAQNSTIKGTVMSEKDNMPIPGVNVIIVKTSTGASTDFDGAYQIQAKAGDVLQFSYLGYTTKTVIVGNQTTINVQLAEDVSQLDEVVVVGYGGLKKSTITSAVSTYKNEKLEQLPVARLDQALQGKIAGVQITNTSSAAGADPVIRIRGQSSINASPDPLVVLDGQPIEDGLGAINMADVESISVLKDASSAAIYGSRGANGVILVTTKSGDNKKTKYTFNTAIGFKSPSKLYEVQTSTEYVNQLYAEQALRIADPLWDSNNGEIPNVSIGDQKQYILENLFRGGEATVYQDEFMRSGVFRTIGLSASGGSKTLRYRISGAYNGDESMMKKSNYDKYQLRLKLNADFSDKISVGVNIAPTYSERQRPPNDYRDFYRFPSFIPVKHTAETLELIQSGGGNQNVSVGDFANPQHFYSLSFGDTNYPMPDGSIYTSTNLANPWTTSSINPLKVLALQDDDEEEFRLQSNIDLTWKITKDLTFRTSANAYFRFSDRVQWVGTNARSEVNENYAVYISREYRDLLSENTLNYIKDFDKHSFNALLGFSAQRTDFSYSSFSGTNYPNENIRTWNNAGTIVKANLNSSQDPGGEIKNATALISYYGRLVYSYDGLFNLTGTIRTDGASQFGPGNKWGVFPSFSGGMNVARLDFLKSSNTVNRLNFRVAYGETGNNRTEPLGGNNAFNPYLNVMTNLPYPGLSIYGASNGNYVTGTGNGSQANGQATPADAGANADITWETTVSTNIGFDLGLFRNRINLSLEFYEANTDKLLLRPNNHLYTGTEVTWNNVGSLRNRGHEIELSTTNIATENFRWTTSANYASNRLNLTDFGGLAETPQIGERGEQYITQVGQPLVQFYGYKTDGVWISQAQIDESGFTNDNVSIGTLVPGSLKLVDNNGDGKIDTDDRTIIGDPYADFTWGMTNTLEYKDIDLSFSFQGVQGIDMYLGDTGYTETKSQVLNYTRNRWVSPSNPGDGQTPYENLGGVNWVQTDYGVDDASYIALRDITLGYNLGDQWSKQIGLNQLRVYVAAQNLLYITSKNYRGLNPESRRSNGTYLNPLITGYDRGGYPVPRTIVMGVDVKF